ncbi:MAG: D-alanine--D-alanine ligase [Gemmiger formicilis]|uniref:D-alanine--D-alanine ligase family protein n=1 Tax=Gemmiger formicilis TaxID=745368 RepID=UPI003FEF12A3|nr:D-alanine--D-alanine ligase [Gemmiger formicilis]
MNQTAKLRVALFFGGVSSEHEVSCVSASTWLRALAQHPCAEQYEVFPVGITKQGRWLACHPTPEAMVDGSWEQGADCTPCVLSPDRNDHGIWLLKDGRAELVRIDICAPVMHGKNGEDGTIQGLFELARIPYVGCGVLGSAVCMDKAVANTIMDAAGVPHCKWASAIRAELEGDHKALLDSIERRLGYPIFVKPANAGSSVGITKATDRAVLEQAIETALKEDDKVVFEEFIDGQEVECAAIGNPDDPATVSTTRPGEILAGAEFYTYDDKYKNGVSQTVIPAHLSEEKLDEVRTEARRAYLALGCAGLSRCDFFVERGTGRVLCNELNTLPGFTSISMYPKLMEHEGLGYAQLVDRLLQLALHRRKGAY